MRPTHALTLDGRTSMEITGSILPLEDEVRRGLANLDGESHFAYSVWPLPAGSSVLDAPAPEEYIQSAGSAAALTVELRRIEDDGEARQYAIGRPGGDTTVVDVPRGDYVMHVPAGEVFTAAEAGDLYWHYYQTGTVPDTFVWRLLDI